MVVILEQVHSFATVALFGLIWTIQLVHYPAFRYIDKEQFIAFEKMHTLKVTLFVAPLMLIELVSVLYLMRLSDFALLQLSLVGITLLIWFSTFFISVPCHKTLAQGKDDVVIEKLIRTNWNRTALWSLKLILIIFFL